jgi:hypothetical protein
MYRVGCPTAGTAASWSLHNTKAIASYNSIKFQADTH